MANKNENVSSSITDEFKEQNSRYSFSKFEHDLYHEEDNVVNKVIRVKRFPLPNKEEKWKVFEDNKVLMVLESKKLSRKQRDFLHSVEGVNFLIKRFKQGNVEDFISLKNDIRNEIKNIPKS